MAAKRRRRAPIAAAEEHLPRLKALCAGARNVILVAGLGGVLVVFLAYLRMMYKPMRDLSKMTDTVSKAGVGFERIREILETELPSRRRRIQGPESASIPSTAFPAAMWEATTTFGGPAPTDMERG